MPRTKTTRSPFGTILKKRLTLYGKKVTVWDARKRYTKASGEKAEKFKRCYAADEAQIALMNLSLLMGSMATFSADFRSIYLTGIVF